MDTLQANVHGLPAELCEQILKAFLEMKFNKKKEQGWREVHDELDSLPFCRWEQLLTPLLFCKICNMCEKNELCFRCHHKGKKHFLLYEEPTEAFTRYH